MPRLAATLPADPFGEVPRVRMPHIPLSRPVVPFTGISTGRDRTLYPNDRPHYYMVSIHTIAIVSVHTIAMVRMKVWLGYCFACPVCVPGRYPGETVP